MTGRLNPVLALATAALLAAPLLSPAPVQAQAADDYKVLIVDFYATDGMDRGFGQKAADELRKSLSAMPGLAPVERGDIQTELRKYNLKFEEMDCSKVRQLASPQLMSTRVAFCVQYASEGENRKIADVEVWDIENGQSFKIPGFTVARNQQKEAAAQIFTGFDTFMKSLNAMTFCAQYAESQSWEDALRNCDQALALNPNAIGTTFLRANILRSMNRNADALLAAEKVIELEPVHEQALQLAGFLATQLNQVEKGRGYYRRYLELNPGDANVRNNIAYAIFEAGDPEGAMQFVEEGLAASNNDVALLTTHGIYAFQAADKASREAGPANSDNTTLSPRVAELYRKAADSFEKVFAAKGDSTDVQFLRNTVVAYYQLQDYPKSIQLAERFMTAYPQDTELLSRYSQALEKSARVDDALAALKKIETIDPAYQNLYPRMGLMLLQANRLDEAIPMLRQAVDKGANANSMAQVLLGPVMERGMKQGAEDWPFAISILEKAKEFPVTPEVMQQFDFYHGYAMFMRTVAQWPPSTSNQPPTKQVACGTQGAFQRARALLVNSRPWAQANNMANNVNALISNSDRYLEIIDIVTKRDGPC
jgi:tetratricopeptide (TPR) repeat protein